MKSIAAPIAISKFALRVFFSALSAMRQIVNAIAPAISCGVFSRSLLNHWLLMRISGEPAARSALFQEKFILAGTRLDRADDLYSGRFRPAYDVGAYAGAVADKFEDLA